jgi:hypothetical protein
VIRDIVQYLDADQGLTYPGIKSEQYPNGKAYTVPWPSRKRGLRLTALAALGRRAAAGETLSEDELAQLQVDDGEGEAEFAQMVLGKPLLHEMEEDGVTDHVVQNIARDAFYNFTSGEELADLVLRGEAAARDHARADTKPKSERAAKPRAGSNSNRASGGTPARTRARASTRSSTTSAAKPARKTA